MPRPIMNRTSTMENETECVRPKSFGTIAIWELTNELIEDPICEGDNFGTKANPAYHAIMNAMIINMADAMPFFIANPKNRPSIKARISNIYPEITIK